MSAPGGGESGVLGDVVGDHGGGDFIHLKAAVCFGDLGRAEAEFASLFQEVAGDRKILVLHLLDVGDDLVDRKLLGCLADEQVLLGEVFRREYIDRLTLFQKKAAAGNSGLRNCCRCRHF